MASSTSSTGKCQHPAPTKSKPKSKPRRKVNYPATPEELEPTILEYEQAEPEGEPKGLERLDHGIDLEELCTVCKVDPPTRKFALAGEKALQMLGLTSAVAPSLHLTPWYCAKSARGLIYDTDQVLIDDSCEEYAKIAYNHMREARRFARKQAKWSRSRDYFLGQSKTATLASRSKGEALAREIRELRNKNFCMYRSASDRAYDYGLTAQGCMRLAYANALMALEAPSYTQDEHEAWERQFEHANCMHWQAKEARERAEKQEAGRQNGGSREVSTEEAEENMAQE